MADETEEHVDTDYSGRPYRLQTVEEFFAAPRPIPPPETGIYMALPDGRRVVLVGGPPPGEWFIVGEDGWPDRDQPVDPRALGLKPRPAAAPPNPKDEDSAGPA